MSRTDVRQLVKDRLLNDSQIARRLGVDPQTVRAVRRGLGLEPLRVHSDVACTLVLPAVAAAAGQITISGVAKRTGRTQQQTRRCLLWLEQAGLVAQCSEGPAGTCLRVAMWSVQPAGLRVLETVLADLLHQLRHSGPMTVAGIAAAIGRPAEQVTLWLEAGQQAELVCIDDHNEADVPLWTLWGAS